MRGLPPAVLGPSLPGGRRCQATLRPPTDPVRPTSGSTPKRTPALPGSGARPRPVPGTLCSSSLPSLDHLEVGHHHVLVLEVVAVEDVLAAVAIEPGYHAHGSALQIKRVLPPGVVWPGRSAVAGEDPEVDQVQVDRMRGIAAYLPDLRRAEARPRIYAIRVEYLAVYRGHPAKDSCDELKPPRHLGVVRVRTLLHQRECVGYDALFLLPARHHEAHDVGGSSLPAEVPQRHFRANLVTREVYDYVETLAWGGKYRVVGDRGFE